MDRKISVTSLSSGSSGNVTYIRAGDTEILIDAGISAKGICCALNEIGTDISNIKAIFVTHEHIDHVKGLTTLSKHSTVPIHMTKESADEYARKHTELRNIIIHDKSYECRLGDILVRSFFSSHDSCACVGYTIETESDKFGIATDMGYVDRSAVEALKNCRSVIIESNYDEKKLRGGNYPEQLKYRIMSAKGHLSNYDCAAFAKYLAENGTKNFMLGHLSEDNNTPELAYNVTSRALSSFKDITLKIAARKEPTFFV